eukprot:TRINITY_DN893_c0_g1_i9.p1 TRINITY_DN893_c0_g1~~TRINITY_DN893_c0_g1_i9.p1  ORF type:complete len:1581 (+),score=692.05 TRINITY_DN893_c0_g1_i9:78-4820(+)
MSEKEKGKEKNISGTSRQLALPVSKAQCITQLASMGSSIESSGVTRAHVAHCYRTHLLPCMDLSLIIKKEKEKQRYCEISRHVCDDNPNCFLSFFSEWRTAIKNIPPESTSFPKSSFGIKRSDPRLAVKEKNSYRVTGLKNLGGTSFVNAVIQMLFSISSFRDTVYAMLPDLDVLPLISEGGEGKIIVAENCDKESSHPVQSFGIEDESEENDNSHQEEKQHSDETPKFSALRTSQLASESEMIEMAKEEQENEAFSQIMKSAPIIEDQLEESNEEKVVVGNIPLKDIDTQEQTKEVLEQKQQETKEIEESSELPNSKETKTDIDQRKPEEVKMPDIIAQEPEKPMRKKRNQMKKIGTEAEKEEKERIEKEEKEKLEKLRLEKEEKEREEREKKEKEEKEEKERIERIEKEEQERKHQQEEQERLEMEQKAREQMEKEERELKEKEEKEKEKEEKEQKEREEREQRENEEREIQERLERKKRERKELDERLRKEREEKERKEKEEKENKEREEREEKERIEREEKERKEREEREKRELEEREEQERKEREEREKKERAEREEKERAERESQKEKQELLDFAKEIGLRTQPISEEEEEDIFAFAHNDTQTGTFQIEGETSEKEATTTDNVDGSMIEDEIEAALSIGGASSMQVEIQPPTGEESEKTVVDPDEQKKENTVEPARRLKRIISKREGKPPMMKNEGIEKEKEQEEQEQEQEQDDEEYIEADQMLGKNETESSLNSSLVLGHLVSLFANLEMSMRQWISPKHLVDSLHLDMSLNSKQKDASEFTQLLLGTIKKASARSPLSSVSNSITNLFESKIGIKVQCTTCGHKKDSFEESTVLKLPMDFENKNLSLQLLVDGFFEETQPEGLMCSRCKSKDTFSKKIALERIPSHMILQLERWVESEDEFNDIQKDSRYVQISETINLAKAIPSDQNAEFEKKKSQNSIPYDVSAIICHVGKDSTSEHYIAYVKGKTSSKKQSQWWRLDDTSALALQSHPFASASNIPASQNEIPYLVMISKIGAPIITDQSDDSTMLTEYLHHPLWNTLTNSVVVDNDKLQEDISNFNTEEKSKSLKLKNEIEKKEGIFQSLSVSPTAVEYYWVSSDWLHKWAQSVPSSTQQEQSKSLSQSLGVINNNEILCPHGGVIPGRKASRKMKRISKGAWVYLSSTYGATHELPHGKECVNCMKEWAKKAFEKYSFRGRKKKMWPEVANAESWYVQDSESPERFYVSRDFIEMWKGLTRPPQTLFDSRLLLQGVKCQHGLLSLDSSKRMLVTFKGLVYLAQMCSGSAPSLPESTSECPTCKKELMKLIETKKEEKSFIDSQLVSSRKVLTNNTEFFAISELWLSRWRKYVDSPSKHHPGPIDNNDIVCHHQLVAVDVKEVLASFLSASLSKKEAPPFSLLSSKGWDALSKIYGVEGPIVKLFLEQFTGSRFTITITPEMILGAVVPGICPECTQGIDGKNIHYSDAKITIVIEDTGASFTLSVCSSSLIKDVKEAIANHLGRDLWPPERQHLRSAHAVLWRGDDTLESSHVLPNTHITLAKKQTHADDNETLSQKDEKDEGTGKSDTVDVQDDEF